METDWWPVVDLCKLHVKRSHKAIVRGQILFKLRQLAYSELVLGQVGILLENSAVGCEINHLEELVKIEIEVSQLLPDQEPLRFIHVVRQGLNLDEGLQSKLILVAVCVAAHRGRLLQVPYNSGQHIDLSFLLEGSTEEFWHPFIRNILVNCHMLSNSYFTVNEVWQVREI